MEKWSLNVLKKYNSTNSHIVWLAYGNQYLYCNLCFGVKRPFCHNARNSTVGCFSDRNCRRISKSSGFANRKSRYFSADVMPSRLLKNSPWNKVDDYGILQKLRSEKQLTFPNNNSNIFWHKGRVHHSKLTLFGTGVF